MIPRVPARAIVLLACAATALSAAPAAASRWPGTRVTYRDHSFFGRGVAEAVRHWNAAGTPVRLVPAQPGRAAQIDIYTPRFVRGLGRAFFPRDGRVFICRFCFSVPPRQVDSRQTPVIAHEIGHALGLGHLRAGCSLMHGDGRALQGCADVEGFYRCGPQRADVLALARLYRVRAQPPPGLGLCRL